jgi:site-specific DNA-methyltransferase (adenine-specific)
VTNRAECDLSPALTYCFKEVTNRVIHGDCLDVLRTMEEGSVDLVYVDPPFNTGRVQRRERLRTVQDDEGDRTGFAGRRYKTEHVSQDAGFVDTFEDYLAFLEPRLREAHRVLSKTGSFYFHIDYREVHYCKVLLDRIFGRASFLNEIIWAYDYGARSKTRWPAKHDNILFYVKDPLIYHFDTEEVDRIPYMARRRPRTGSSPPTRGGTPSLARPARRSSATRRRSRSGSSSASCVRRARAEV